MPYIGHIQKVVPETCCKLPWFTAFRREGTLWQCPKCKLVYRLIKEAVPEGPDCWESMPDYPSTPKK